VQAGILEERYGDSDVPVALLSDAHLQERQKQVLLELYEAYRRENGAVATAAETLDIVPDPAPTVTTRATRTPAKKTTRTRTARRAKPRAAAGAGGAAVTAVEPGEDGSSAP
jgi:hypothetical protein